ncbi:MAG TPA: adenylate/guanylate cyclase domain-containing protein [Gaiellaceae bacterium]|nr:adenylate/guanylate cyclase domain-containing protein [Gaiellaceae bacterium]
MITCSNCGAESPSGQNFCGECGTALAATCASCGAANPPGQKFCGECGSALATSTLTEAPAVAVERRLVSVLFADLVGSTALSEDRDAEEVRDLLSRYFEIAAGIVGRYGGQVEKFIGDAVMAVWGTPVAQEDDAERAVRAALELVGGVSDFGREAGIPELAARAAVLTGETAVNLGAAGQGMVAGDLVNTASRVQSAAEPHTVLVGESTRRATEAAVAYADAGTHELKGKAEPMPLWRALRVTAGRAGGLKSEGIEPPFVGRERELRLAKELFHAAADEHKAHLLSIVGIAGIGKSRLSWELYKYFDGITQEVAWHRGRCLAYGDGVTYWALAEMARMRAGIAEGEVGETARPKLDAALESNVGDAEERAWIRPRLAQLLSLETSELEQADLFAGWRLFFERLAERDPVVLVFEDMQWADAPLLEFIEYLLEWSRNHAILVLALARPELAERRAQWAGGLRNATTLSLEPLSPEAMEALLDGFVPGLPDQLRTQVLERSEGVPLYAVETVRMLLDRGLLEQVGDEYRPAGPIEALDVPETLQALIAARLDGLPPEERSVLQDAAVLGKTFTKPALVAVSGLDEAELDDVLLALVRKEVLSLQADPRSPERGQHSFLQDLLRQVAYETLSRKERRARHLAAAAHLEQQWLEDDDELVEIVASHVLSAIELDPDADDAGELRTRAEAMLARAGERAATLGGNESAQRYFEQAIELADSPRRAAELHERAGQMARFGVRVPDARSHFEAAIKGFEGIGLTHPAARVRSQLGLLVWGQEGDIAKAIADMEAAFDVLAADERDADLAQLAVSLARPLFFTGRHEEAMARNELALEIAESLELPEVLSHGLNTKGLILSARGRPEEAWLLMRHALEVALANDLSTPAIRAYINSTALVSIRNREREALELSLRGRELARKIGDRDSEGFLQTWVMGIRATLGEWDAVLAEEEPIELRDRPRLFTQGAVAPIFAARGDLEEARRRVEAVREFVDAQEVQSVAGFKTIEAEVLLAEGRPREALLAAEEVVAVRGDVVGGLAPYAKGYALALEAAIALGDDAKVDELLAIVERLPPGELSPFLGAIGARFSAQRAARRADGDTAAAGFSAAARLLQEIEYPFELAVILLEHAEWLAGEGRFEEAEPLAAEARQIFERLRATPYIERVDRLPVGALAPG